MSKKAITIDDIYLDGTGLYRDIISVGASENLTVSGNTEVKIPIDTVVASIGDKLTLDADNNNVIIGAGVSYVMVTATCSPYATAMNTGNYCRMRLYKGSSNYSSYSVRSDISIRRPSMTLANILVPVEEGDTLSLYYYQNNSSASTVLESTAIYMTVEVVK